MGDTAYVDRDGVKLCKADRPPMETIGARLNERVPLRLQNLFVVDIQNDCCCSTETYDAWFEAAMIYISPDGIKAHTFGDRLPLPMKPDFSEKDIWDLLEAGSKKASTVDDGHVVFCHMLHNPSSPIDKVGEAFVKHCGYININRSGDKMGWMKATFVPKDCVFFLPEPEFFGVISVNIDKFGAFCLARNMLRIEL